MKFKSRAPFVASLIAAASIFAAGGAYAGATIFNTGAALTATVAMGINDDGSLNTPDGTVVSNSSRTGVAFKFADGSWRDATSPGCFCEGWGVSTSSGVGHSGFANVSSDGGPNNLTFGLLTGVTGSTATATTSLTSLPGLTVTQTFAPSAAAPGALFEVKVKITNTTTGALNDVKYVRVMDWDVPPTEFSEYVTIKGTATTTLLERSHDNGFASANPLTNSSGSGGTLNADFTDNGPADHGAYFRFNFGTLAEGASQEFSIFYGAAADEAGADAARIAAGLELYSYGQSKFTDTAGNEFPANDKATFIFGFKGVGGTCEDCNDTPEPGSLALVGLGLLGAGALRRRGSRRQA